MSDKVCPFCKVDKIEIIKVKKINQDKPYIYFGHCTLCDARGPNVYNYSKNKSIEDDNICIEKAMKTFIGVNYV